MDILSKLKAIIDAKGLSINKVTELSGLSENTVYNWYNKGAEPSIRALNAVCDVLGISIASLLCDESDIKYYAYNEQEMLRRYRTLSAKRQELLLQLIKEME